MEFNSMLLKLQIKRAIKLIPKLIIGSLMIIILVAFLVFFSARKSNEKTVITKSRVALVSEGNEFVNNVALQVLDGMESINTLFEFVQLERNEAMEALKKGELTAVTIFPDTFIEGVRRGDNIPAEVYMKGDKDSFGVGMVSELCVAVQQILVANEAGTYAMNDLLNETGYNSLCHEYDENLDLYTFKLLFERIDNFERINLVGEKDSTLAQGFVASGLVLMILLLGMSCGSIFKSEARAFEEKLKEVKVGHFKQLLYKLIALTVLLFIIYALVALGAVAFYGRFSSALKEIYIYNRAALFYMLLVFIPCIILAACFTMFSFTFADNQIGGILLLFSVTIVSSYISGMLYPTSYLPKTVISLQRFVPTTYMHRQAVLAINGDFDLGNMAVLLGWALGFYLISVMIKKYRSRRA